MNSRNNWIWILGVLVVIVVLLGFWWLHGSQGDMTGNVNYGTGSSTPDALLSSAGLPPVSPVVAESRPSSTVNAIVASLSGESRFAGLLSSTGVSSLITGKGPYTVFVPTNAAFSLLPPGALNLSATGLKRLVEYHIVSGKKINVNIQTSGTIQALSKDMLNFSVLTGDKSARINSSVALHEYVASNGVVYVISEVLLPPYDALQQ
jgi:uncharacterized surface protein with fasciclin (FAS1) repeats